MSDYFTPWILYNLLRYGGVYKHWCTHCARALESAVSVHTLTHIKATQTLVLIIILLNRPESLKPAKYFIFSGLSFTFSPTNLLYMLLIFRGRSIWNRAGWVDEWELFLSRSPNAFVSYRHIQYSEESMLFNRRRSCRCQCLLCCYVVDQEYK